MVKCTCLDLAGLTAQDLPAGTIVGRDVSLEYPAPLLPLPTARGGQRVPNHLCRWRYVGRVVRGRCVARGHCAESLCLKAFSILQGCGGGK